MTFHQLHIEEVALPSLTVQSEPHCGQCDIWLRGARVSEGSGFYIHVFVPILSKAHFMMSKGLLFTPFLLNILVFYCKDENLVAFLFIHTIQLTFTASKSHQFFFFFFFFVFCLTCKLKN